MSYQIELRIPVLPEMQADVMEWRVRAKYRKDWHKRIWEAVLVSGGPPKKPLLFASCFGVRYSSIEPDRINLWNGFKAPVDGLHAKHAGVILDDSPQVLLEEGYSWEKAAPGQGRILLVIRELAPPVGTTCPFEFDSK